MYEILKLFAVHRNSISSYDPSQISPQQFQALSDLDTVLYLLIRSAHLQNRVAINYSRLITDRNVGQSPSWSQLINALNLEHMLGYSEPIPGYGNSASHPRNPLVTWDAMNTLETFDLTYASAELSKAGLYPFRYNFHDLKISLQDNDNIVKPNLHNCIPIVNGFTCRPVYKDDALYALNGSKLCWFGGFNIVPEVLLLDFEHIGQITMHPMYIDKFPDESFSVSFANRRDALSLYSDWIFTSQYSLYEYTPIIVLCGLTILPDKISIISEHSCRIGVHDIPFNKALAMQAYFEAGSISASDTAYGSERIADYLDNELTRSPYDVSNDCFVILIKSPRVFVNRVGLDVWENGITVDAYTEEGLLLHEPTHRILGYHCQTFSNKKELTLQNAREVYLTDHLYLQKQLCFLRPDCDHNTFQDLHKGNCKMLHICGA